MQTITKTIQAFQFKELTESAQQNALREYLESSHDIYFGETVKWDFETICEMLGFERVELFYTGFHSQGDGASFSAKYYSYAPGALAKIKAYAPHDVELIAIAQNIQNIQRKAFYRIAGEVTRRGYYYHEMTMQFDHADMLGAFRDLARWAYRALECEYKYVTGVEYFADMADINNWYFDVNGYLVDCE
jgi:hypothetical protein